jgi:streptogramin lyase
MVRSHVSALLTVLTLTVAPAGLAEGAGPVVDFATPTANSGSQGITLGADGNLWFTEQTASRIGRVTPTGVITEFPLSAGREPIGITSGPDGNIWFTEFGGDRIGRLNPNAGSQATIQASIVEFIVPGVGSQPFGITPGPDGNLWFTQRGSSQIGRITPAGTVTEFGSGFATQPLGITAGPDGKLWYGSDAPNRLGRITTDGVPEGFTGFGDLQTKVLDLTTGPDGFVWATGGPGQRVIRFASPVPVTTEFPVNGDPQDIVAGPDGNLWFTGLTGNFMGAVNTQGQLVTQQFVPTTASQPVGLAFRGNRLWFVESATSKVGRFSVDVAAPGDFDQDGQPDVVVGAGAGGGPHVRVLNGATGASVRELFPFDPLFTGGVRVAVCDLNGDGAPDILAAAGPGGGPHVRAFDGKTSTQLPGAIGSFFAYSAGFLGGVNVGCQDVNGDDVPDVITGPGAGGGPHLRVFSGVDGAEIFGAFVYPPGFTGGVFVGP